jgi:hypothetical protein
LPVVFSFLVRSREDIRGDDVARLASLRVLVGMVESCVQDLLAFFFGCENHLDFVREKAAEEAKILETFETL